MSRRFANPDPGAQDRWIISYADFVTLLFAFFVVMYSISSVNEGKYRLLTGSLSEAFDVSQGGEVIEIMGQQTDEETPDVGLPTGPDETESGAIESAVIQPESNDEGLDYDALVEDQYSAQALDLAEQEIDELGEKVEQQVPELIDQDLIEVRRNKFWLEVEIKSNLLFTSGSSILLEDAIPILQELSRSFVEVPNRLNIEGFTDNEPIANLRYPSNWELSAARAATVVRLFEEQGIEPLRMASIGYGEHHPIADNESAEGRARNRRVVIIVMADIKESPDQRLYALDLDTFE